MVVLYMEMFIRYKLLLSKELFFIWTVSPYNASCQTIDEVF